MRLILIIFLNLIFICLDAQNNNLQVYTPSVLLEKNNFEYKFFNNLYTQTKGYNEDRVIETYTNRSSYFSSINQFLYGVSPKINIGADFWLKSVRIDEINSSPFKIFSFENSQNTRTALSGIGPKIKVSPFKKLSNLSIQSTFLFPVTSDLEGKNNAKPYLSENSYIWYTQIFYDQAITNKLQLFLRIAPWLYIKKGKSITLYNRFNYANPISAFVSYFATKKLTIYIENEFWLSFSTGGISSWFRQEGIGIKYQIIEGFLESELLYTKFTMGRNSGAGETFNFGLRFIH